MKPRVNHGGDGAPPEPDWQDVYTDPLDIEAAGHEWGLVIRELQGVETLTVANGHMIERLVKLRIQWRRADRHVAEHGPVFPPKGRAKTGQWNPYWTVWRQCDEAMRLIEGELCLPPLRRAKAGKAPKAKKAAKASDEFLGPAADSA